MIFNNINLLKLNKLYEETEKMKADVSSFVAASQANSNKDLLTDNYVKLQLGQMLANNTKMYFSGSDSIMGAVLGKIFGTPISGRGLN